MDDNTRDLIHRLVIPTGDDGNPVLPADWDEAVMRAEFRKAGNALDAIRALPAGEMTLELADRKAALLSFQTILRDAVVRLVDAAKADLVGDLPAVDTVQAAGTPVHEDVPPGHHPQAQPLNPPATHVPAEPDAAPAKPAKAPKAENDVEVVEPELIAAGLGTVVTATDGTTYRLVRNDADAQAAAVGADQLAAAAAQTRGTGRLVLPATPVGRGLHRPTVPMLAAVAGQTLGGGNLDAHGNEVTAGQIGQQLHRFANSSKAMSGSGQQYLFRRDRLADVGVDRLTTDMSPAAAQAAIDMQRDRSEAILAAFCGPAELDRTLDLMAPSTARPVAAAMGQTTAIGIGVHEFFREMGLADLLAHYTANSGLPTGVGVWTSGDQATVDPTDPDTWKPYFSLPGCPPTVKVAAYFLYQALRVNVEDAMSRPQYIENITLLMEVMLARLAEQALLETIDGWSFQRTVAASPTGYGASRQLYYVMRQVLTWATTATRTNPGAYTLILPDTLAAVASIDGAMSGDGANYWSDLMRDAGINVLVTPDWGLEGNPMAPLPVQPTPDAPDGSAGGAVPALPSVYTVRLAPMGDFVHGVVGIEDYGVNTSPDLKRQNAVEYFGETAEIAYKKGGFPSFSLTLSGMIGNGARPDMVAPFTYGSPVVYANNMPAAAPKIGSGFVAGQQL